MEATENEEYTDEEVVRAIKKIGEKCTCGEFNRGGFASTNVAFGTAAYVALDSGPPLSVDAPYRYYSSAQFDCPVHGDELREMANQVFAGGMLSGNP